VCCSVLQCVAVCCSVLQCVAVCCSVLQCVAVCCSILQCVVACCSPCTTSREYIYMSHVTIYIYESVCEYIDDMPTRVMCDMTHAVMYIRDIITRVTS